MDWHMWSRLRAPALPGRWLLAALVLVTGWSLLGVSRAAASSAFAPAVGSPFAINGTTGSVGGYPDDVTFSPDGRLLAMADAKEGVSVFSVAPGGGLTQVAGSPYETTGHPGTDSLGVAFNPTGTLLAVANDDSGGEGTVSVFTVTSGGALTQIDGSPFPTGASYAQSVAFSRNGQLLATANPNANSVSMFSVASGGALTAIGSPVPTGTYTSPYAVAFSPTSDLLMTADSGTSGVSVFTVGSGGSLMQITNSPFATGRYPEAVAFSPDGGLLATASIVNGTVSMFSVASGGALTEVTGSPFTSTTSTQGTFGVGFSPHGLFASTNGDSTVSVFTVDPAGTLTPIGGSPFAVDQVAHSVAFSPDGSLFATDSSSFSVSTASVFTVAPPSASVSSPGGQQTYAVGQSVPTAFACSDALFAPGIASCTDANGTGSPGTLNTATPGPHTYTVTAVSSDRQTASANLTYTVAAAPSAAITSPVSGGRYQLGQAVPTHFACSDGTGGPGLLSCSDSTGATSAAGATGHLDTSSTGSRTYTVTAVSRDGQRASRSIAYVVTSPVPPPKLTALRLSARRFKPAPHGSTLTRAGRAPTTISYHDTLAATTTFAVLRCTAKRNRCSRLRAAGSFSRHDSAGANRVGFTGRLRGHALAAGVYRLRVTATSHGRHSTTLSVTFTAT